MLSKLLPMSTWDKDYKLQPLSTLDKAYRVECLTILSGWLEQKDCEVASALGCPGSPGRKFMYRMLFSLTLRPLLDWLTTQIWLENVLSAESIVLVSTGDLGGEVLLGRVPGTGGS